MCQLKWRGSTLVKASLIAKLVESSASAGSWTTEAPWYGERQDLRKLPCLSQACLELSGANTENLTLEVALPPSTVLC